MVLDGNQYRIIVESAPNMLWRAGKDALCDYFNTTWLNYTGRTMQQEVGNGWAEGVHPEDYERCLKTFLEAFDKRAIFEMIYRLRRHDGQWRWIHDRGTPFYDDNDEFAGYIGSCIDVNEQIMGETWKAMAQRDGLTGILNRQYVDQEAKRYFDIARLSKKSMCAIMLDIDNFKYYNDHFGHAFGDKVLVAFADVLRDSIRDADLLGRYGGDEFIIFLPETGYYGAVQIINRIAIRLAQPIMCDTGTEILLSFSYGISEQKEGDTFKLLVESADHAMYEEKKRRKEEALADSSMSSEGNRM